MASQDSEQNLPVFNVVKKKPLSRDDYDGLIDKLMYYSDHIVGQSDMEQIFEILSKYFFVNTEKLELKIKEKWGNSSIESYDETKIGLTWSETETRMGRGQGKRNRIPANSLLVISDECNPMLDENGKCRCNMGYSGRMLQLKDNMANATEVYTHKQNLLKDNAGYLTKEEENYDKIFKLKYPSFNENWTTRKWDSTAGIKFDCGREGGRGVEAISSILQMIPFLAWLEGKLFDLNLSSYAEGTGRTDIEPITIETLLNNNFGDTDDTKYVLKGPGDPVGSTFYKLLKNFQTSNHLELKGMGYEEISAVHQKQITKINAALGGVGLVLGFMGLPFITLGAVLGDAVAIAGVVLALPGPLADFTRLDDGDKWVKKAAAEFKIRIETLQSINIGTTRSGDNMNLYELLRFTYYSVHKKTFRSLMGCAEKDTDYNKHIQSKLQLEAATRRVQNVLNATTPRGAPPGNPIKPSAKPAQPPISSISKVFSSLLPPVAQQEVQPATSMISRNPRSLTPPPREGSLTLPRERRPVTLIEPPAGGGGHVDGNSLKKSKRKIKKSKIKRKKINTRYSKRHKSKTKRRKRSKIH